MIMSDDCKHNQLQRIEGPLHPSGKDYVCTLCGEQFRAEELAITVHMGLKKLCMCGHELELHDDQAVCRALVDGKKSCQCLQYGSKP